MAQELVSDELWGLIEPLLPPPRPQPKGGCRPKPNRAVLTGIVFVLKSGIPWEMLPQDNGLWLWDDLLAPFAGVAAGRRVAETPPRVVKQARPSRADRLVPSGD